MVGTVNEPFLGGSAWAGTIVAMVEVARAGGAIGGEFEADAARDTLLGRFSVEPKPKVNGSVATVGRRA